MLRTRWACSAEPWPSQLLNFTKLVSKSCILPLPHTRSRSYLRSQRSRDVRHVGLGLGGQALDPAGHVFIFNQAAISWGSKKQKSVALSSCEAEIVAASEAATEAIHLERFVHVREFDLKDSQPIDLFVDNKSAIDVAYNPEHHTRMKHVERRHFFIRELVEEPTRFASRSSARSTTWPTSSLRL